MKRKWVTGLKIGFCVLLCAVMVCAGLGVRFGRNCLHAKLLRVRNSDFFERICLDFDGSQALMRGFSVTPQQFNDYFVLNADMFYGQKLQVAVQNRTKNDLTVLGLEVRPEDEDRFGLFVKCTPESVVTVPAGTKTPTYVWFDVLAEDLDNEQTLSVLRKEFVLKILYADASEGFTCLEDADDGQLQSEWVRRQRSDTVRYSVKSHEDCRHYQRTLSRSGD